MVNKGLIYWGAVLVVAAGLVVTVVLIENGKVDVKAIKGKGKDRKLKKDAKILFVGDSMTSEFYLGQPTNTYAYLIKHKYLTDKTIDILAETGKPTSWMLANLPSQLAKKQYDRVYLWGGINDIYGGVSAAKATANIQSMVNLVAAHGGVAYVILGYNTKNFTPDTKATSITSRNNYIVYQNYLKDTIKNAVVLPEFELSSSMSAADGIHPSLAAHEIIAKILLDGIEYEK